MGLPKRKKMNWEEINNILRGCDLKTAKKMLEEENSTTKRVGVIKRIVCRITRLERDERRKNLLKGL